MRDIPVMPEGWNKRRWIGIVRRCRKLATQHRQLAKVRGEILPYDSASLIALVRVHSDCAWCKERLLPSTLSFDHALPLARGGAIGVENLLPSCRRCNKRKGQLTSDEYADILETIEEWELVARTDVLMRLAAGSGMLRMLRAKRGDAGELHGKGRRTRT